MLDTSIGKLLPGATLGSVLVFGLSSMSEAAVTFSGKETTIAPQTISAGAADFFLYDGTQVVTKQGGIADWSFATGIILGGDAGAGGSLTWENGDPTASGTTSATMYIPLGSGYDQGQLSSGSVSFKLKQASPTVGLTLYTMPVANSGIFTYDYAITVNGIPQFTQIGNVDSSDSFDTEILRFSLTDLAADDVVTFTVSNAVGANPWHNFALLGGELVIPEPSSGLLAGLAASAMILRPRRRQAGR